MKNVCPKCKRQYTNGGKNHKSSHHIIPRWVFSRRPLPTNIRKMLDEFTLDMCRACHSEFHEILDKLVRDLMYEEHQGLFIKALTTFLGGDHAIPDVPREIRGGLNGSRGWNRPPSRLPAHSTSD